MTNIFFYPLYLTELLELPFCLASMSSTLWISYKSRSCSICPSVPGLFHLAKWPLGAATLSQTAGCLSLAWLLFNYVYQIYHIFFVHLSTDGHLGWFNILWVYILYKMFYPIFASSHESWSICWKLMAQSSNINWWSISS